MRAWSTTIQPLRHVRMGAIRPQIGNFARPQPIGTNSQCLERLHECRIFLISCDDDPTHVYASCFKNSFSNTVYGPLITFQLREAIFVILALAFGCSISNVHRDELYGSERQTNVSYVKDTVIETEHFTSGTFAVLSTSSSIRIYSSASCETSLLKCAYRPTAFQTGAWGCHHSCGPVAAV